MRIISFFERMLAGARIKNKRAGLQMSELVSQNLLTSPKNSLLNIEISTRWNVWSPSTSNELNNKPLSQRTRFHSKETK